jgi:hypothetical protein
MNGVTTAIVAFQLLCIAFPGLVKRKSHFYITLGLVFAIILLDALANMIGSPKFGVLVYALVGFLQCASLFVLAISVGGMSARELTESLAGALEVLRSGEPEKEIVIPISGPMRQVRPVVYKDVGETEENVATEGDHKVYTINDPQPDQPASPSRPKADHSSPIPLD